MLLRSEYIMLQGGGLSEVVFLKVVNGILLPKLFSPTVRKKCSSDREKTFEIRGCLLRICKIFEITRTIYSKTVKGQNNF